MRAGQRIFGAIVLSLTLAACVSDRETQVAPAPYQVACGCEQDLIDHVGDRVFFQFDESALSNDAHATLGRQAAWIAKYPTVDVLIAGNADERGTETYNLALGQRRANAVRDYLVLQGVSGSRIRTISYGKDCPVAFGNDEATDQQNRDAITSVSGMNPQNCH